MSSRLVGTRRPRLLPRALLASGLVVTVACTAVAATAGPARQSVQTCPANQEWVTVEPVVVDGSAGLSRPERRAAHPASATLAGCVDTRDLPSQLGPPDSRG
jgi:hypothetical protein